MRPLTKGPGNGYKPPAAFSWKKKTNPALWAALVEVFAIADAQEHLAISAEDSLRKQATLKDLIRKKTASGAERMVADAIDAKITAEYTRATNALVKELGSFCAFCEIRITERVQVEHVANKSYYPLFALAWENFLPCCGPCNTMKGTKPSPSDVSAWPPAVTPSLAIQEQAQFRDRIRDHYRWPDAWDDTFQYFRIRFEFSEDENTWVRMAERDAANYYLNRYDRQEIESRTVIADVVHEDVIVRDARVRVYVEPDGLDLVDVCGLNKVGNLESTYDRRVFNRTLAWFSALEVIAAVKTAQDEAQFQRLWKVVCVAAESGYWSLWVTLLNQHEDIYSGTGDTLATRFYKDLIRRGSFPGTNVRNLELAVRTV
jgi:uncharacterized protein (TIGR02646 family)